VRKHRPGVVAALLAIWVLAIAVPTAAAANPNRSFAFSACLDSPGYVEMTVTWSGFKVDEATFGFGDGTGQGYGVVDPLDVARQGTQSEVLGSDPQMVIAAGAVLFHGHVIASDSIDVPSGGWDALTPC
jgi:hypothetical protein